MIFGDFLRAHNHSITFGRLKKSRRLIIFAGLFIPLLFINLLHCARVLDGKAAKRNHAKTAGTLVQASSTPTQATGTLVQASSTPTQAPSNQPFRLWQLPSLTTGQMMSYVILANDKIYVIDGGNRADAGYLVNFIHHYSDKVEGWFISHPHPDHINALTEVLENNLIEIRAIYHDLPDEDWVRQNEPGYISVLTGYKAAEQAYNGNVVPVHSGDLLDFDGFKVEILSGFNPEIVGNPINNSSVALRVSDLTRSVLFLGDLGVSGGNKLLQKYSGKLKTKYVQMAHHGQNGVAREVYNAIAPEICLWPTPAWLWDNNNSGKGVNSGPWKTLETRQWMKELNVRINYVSKDGLQEIDGAK